MMRQSTTSSCVRRGARSELGRQAGRQTIRQADGCDVKQYFRWLDLQRKEQIVQFLASFEENFESNILLKPEVLADLRQFLKKRHAIVKADNEKRMKFTRPIVVQDGNGMSLFEEFKGDGISEWEIHMIMKYASFNQDVNLILERMVHFQNDAISIQRLRVMLHRFESQVVQTNLDYRRDANEEDDENAKQISSLRSKDSKAVNATKQPISKAEKQQLDLNRKRQNLITFKKNYPEKFSGFLRQFETVREHSNAFKIANAETKTTRNESMWADKMNSFSKTAKAQFIQTHYALPTIA